MKKITFLMIVAWITGSTVMAQLTGTKNIPGDYANFYSAVFALNTVGVGPGGVTFVIAGDYSETLPNDSAGLIKATGTATNPILFQRGAVGANPVIMGSPAAVGLNNYVIGLQGTDYITFDGIDVKEPTGACEYGYAVLKASASNGSQYVVIRNCNISLSKTNTSSVGINSANVTPGAPTVPLTVDAPTGANSYNKYYSNNINNCYNGISLNGYNDPNDPYLNYDISNEIGKDGGNTITSQGGSTVASNGIITTYQNRLFVANNLITGTVNGTATTSGIQIGTAKNANLDVLGNTVTLTMADAATNTFYGIWVNMGSTFTNNYVNANNNLVTSCAYPKATSATFYGMYVSTSAFNSTVAGNNITNNSYGGSTVTATGTCGYIYYAGSPPLAYTTSINNNVVSGNVRTQSVVGSGTNYYIYAAGGGSISGPLYSIYSNLVSNNTASSNGTTAGIYAIGATLNRQLYNNTITGILNARGTVHGIYSGEGFSQYIFGNRIQNLTTLGTTTSIAVNGLYLSGSSVNGSLYAYNNMVSELKAPNSPNAAAVYGINGNASGIYYLGVYHNSIYLNGTSSASGFGTVGIYLGSAPNTVDLRNNIIINATTPTGTGIAAAIKSASYSATLGILNYGPDCNNNVLNAGTPASNHVICWSTGGTTSNLYEISLNDFKTRMWPRECYSIDDMPPFINVASEPYDLHLLTNVPTQCEGNGQIITTPVNVSTDLDNDPRYPNYGYPVNPIYPPFGPDRGADEIGGLPIDALPPAIIFTALENTASLENRTLIANIKDLNGVPVSGIGLPRICWKKNASGTWNYVTGVSQGNDNYEFTFGGGVSLNDTVWYFVVAQDMYSTPNAGTFPLVGSQGISANPPAAITPPSNAYTYKIVPGMCGLFHVGVGQDFPTLTAAMDTLKKKAVTCPLILELTDNSYPSETWPMVIGRISGASATNTITIRPAAGVTPVFATSYLGVSPNPWSMLSFNGTEYVILDGSNSGGSDRSMTFSNNATGVFVAAIGLYNNGYKGASNIVIKNCVIQAHAEDVYNTQGIVFYSISGGAGYKNITIDNNDINSAKYGVLITGVATGLAENVTLTNNTIGSMDISKACVRTALGLSQCNNVLIEGNDIIGAASGFSYVAQSPLLVYASTGAKNVTMRKNKIHDMYSLTNGAVGIYWDADASTPTDISNNLVYNIKAVGTNTVFDGANAVGIFIRSGNNVKLNHNTVSMQGNYLSSTTAVINSCVVFRNNISGIEFRNNILKNSSQPVSGAPSSKSYCIMTGNNPVFTTLNYNDYYCDGIGARIGYSNATDRTTLADWQAAMGQDANSVSIDPQFTALDNLMPTTTNMVKAGTYLSQFPVDFAGVTRTNPPDIGAYEYSLMPVITTQDATSVTTAEAVLNGTIGPNGHNVLTYFDFGTTTAYGQTFTGTPDLVTGNSVQAISASLTGLIPGTTYHYRLRGVTFTGTIVYGNDKSFTTQSLPCATPFAVIVSQVLSASASVSWSAPSPEPGSGYEYELRTSGDPGSGATGLVASGATNAGITTVNLTGLTPSTSYSVYIRSNCGDGSFSLWTSAVVFVTLPVLNISVTGTIGNGISQCYNATNVITVAGGGNTFTVENGGSATFIAGSKIRYLAGTKVFAGGYMHGYITLTNEYCSQTPNPVVSNPVFAGITKETSDLNKADEKGNSVAVYPNPFTESFTLQVANGSEMKISHAEIQTMNGVSVLSLSLPMVSKTQIQSSSLKPGIFILRVTTTGGVKVHKLVKVE
jgi:hypothetical protein